MPSSPCRPIKQLGTHVYYKPSLFLDFGNEEFTERWCRLCESHDTLKPMVCSLAPDDEALDALGIKSNVGKIFRRAKLDYKEIMRRPAYKDLVYEFLSTLVVDEGSGIGDLYSGWQFRIQNITFTWSRQDVAKFLHFPEDGFPAYASEGERQEMWRKLTGQGKYFPSNSPNEIARNTWRYIHQLVSTNINYQPETINTVTEEDLHILWALDNGKPVNWFDVFSERFIKMQGEFGSNFVGCTSLITRIAEVCGFRFYCQFDEYKKLDVACLRKLMLLNRNLDGTLRPIKRGPLPWYIESLEEGTSEASADEAGPSTSEAANKKIRIERGLDEDEIERVGGKNS